MILATAVLARDLSVGKRAIQVGDRTERDLLAVGYRNREGLQIHDRRYAVAKFDIHRHARLPDTEAVGLRSGKGCAQLVHDRLRRQAARVGELVESQPDLRLARIEVLVGRCHVVARQQPASKVIRRKFELRQILPEQLDLEVVAARAQRGLGEVGLHQVRDRSGSGPPRAQHLFGGHVSLFAVQKVDRDGRRVRPVVLDIHV